MIDLAVVIPCYNEEEVLQEIAARLKDVYSNLQKKGSISESSFILFVNDGSVDHTWQGIVDLHTDNEMFKGINLSSNVGHQKALLAGLHFVEDKCDAAISIDADMQDDINVIEEMLIKFTEGNDLVYGVRKSRGVDSVFKRLSAKSFYVFMQFIGVKTIFNHADFRLMSARVLTQLRGYNEVNVFLRGVFPLIGYKSEKVYYERQRRFAGKSKYPFRKMVLFALDGITSFSIRPLRLIIYIGSLSFLASIVSFIYVMESYFRGGNIQGWTSVMISLWFLGSLTLMSLGIIGEYIGKIYTEIKARPRYHIESILYK